MNIQLNGKSFEVDAELTVQQALQKWKYLSSAVAVAVNETFVPRSQYDRWVIRDGDRIEVVSAMQGG